MLTLRRILRARSVELERLDLNRISVVVNLHSFRSSFGFLERLSLLGTLREMKVGGCVPAGGPFIRRRSVITRLEKSKEWKGRP